MALTKNKLIEIVTNVTRDVDLTEDGSFDLPFADIGIDSMDMLQILLKVEKAVGFEIPNEEVDDLTSLNSMLLKFNK